MAGPNMLEFTTETFQSEVLESDKPVLVDFSATWCMPCKALEPVIDEIATEYAGRVKVGKVDTDGNKEVSVRYGISSIPTVILFQNGEIKEQFIGLKRKKDFSQALDSLLVAS